MSQATPFLDCLFGLVDPFFFSIMAMHQKSRPPPIRETLFASFSPPLAPVHPSSPLFFLLLEGLSEDVSRFFGPETALFLIEPFFFSLHFPRVLYKINLVRWDFPEKSSLPGSLVPPLLFDFAFFLSHPLFFVSSGWSGSLGP